MNGARMIHIESHLIGLDYQLKHEGNDLLIIFEFVQHLTAINGYCSFLLEM